jgi:transposase
MAGGLRICVGCRAVWRGRATYGGRRPCGILRTVAVGLDVHKSSVRLAAVRAGELLREVTLAYDHERVEGELRAWPGARVVYEAGPTGFGLYRYLIAAGVNCEVVAPGLVPTRPGDRVKTDKRDARRLAALHARAC